MLTKEQATNAREFHVNGCTKYIGKRSGVNISVTRYRRASQIHTWVRYPDKWQFTVKFGMSPRTYTITDRDATYYHVAEDCPVSNMCCSDTGHGASWSCYCKCHAR